MLIVMFVLLVTFEWLHFLFKKISKASFDYLNESIEQNEADDTIVCSFISHVNCSVCSFTFQWNEYLKLHLTK